MRPLAREPVAWALTTGEAGLRTQARGLAGAVAGTVIEKTVRLHPLWRRIPAGVRLPLSALAPGSDPVAPPWPDLVVSCGRRAAAVALAIQRAAGGRVALVHVQDPQARRASFDLIVAMPHDRLSGANVLTVRAALHDQTPETLAAAAAMWAPRLAHLPMPFVGVLLGGSTNKVTFGLDDAEQLIGRLERLHAATGGTLLVTPSRRTPPQVVARFAGWAHDNPAVWLWPGVGDNPYRAVLALSDRLVATADSVSMISEALATSHPVEVFMLPVGARHRMFLQSLEAEGLIRPFEGTTDAMRPRARVDSMQEAAAAVRALLSRRAA